MSPNSGTPSVEFGSLYIVSTATLAFALQFPMYAWHSLSLSSIYTHGFSLSLWTSHNGTVFAWYMAPFLGFSITVMVWFLLQFAVFGYLVYGIEFSAVFDDSAVYGFDLPY